MKIIKFIAISFILLGNFPFENLVYAEVKKPEDYKVLTKNNKKLSVSNIKYYIKEGDDFITNSNFEKAKESYLNARKLSKELASFYSDLNTAFKGIDARIPSAMQMIGKETLQFLAETNKRLVALYIRNEKPEVAVPLLIETIRIMSPDSIEGKEAYQKLIQLGFVETEYKG